MDRRSQPARRVEASYPFVHTLRSQFRDLDPLGHVNNVVVAAYYEDARTHFLSKRWGGGRSPRSRPEGYYVLVVNVNIDYLGEALHPREFRVACGISRIGTSSVVVSQALFSEGTCIGLADATVVTMKGDRPAPIPDERRSALAEVLVDFSGEQSEKEYSEANSGLPSA
jgi:acyl-CoA thioester hydrolase